MRHAAACLALGAVLTLAGCIVDSIAVRSPAAGVVLAWTDDPARLLNALPAGQARVVDMWLSGRLIQLHVESMRQFDAAAVGASASIRLPQTAVLLAGCG